VSLRVGTLYLDSLFWQLPSSITWQQWPRGSRILVKHETTDNKYCSNQFPPTFAETLSGGEWRWQRVYTLCVRGRRIRGVPKSRRGEYYSIHLSRWAWRNALRIPLRPTRLNKWTVLPRLITRVAHGAVPTHSTGRNPKYSSRNVHLFLPFTLSFFFLSSTYILYLIPFIFPH
jgi:hypothetical protein